MSTKETKVARYWAEKKTDTGIACTAVNDAHLHQGVKYDLACIVSDDSDMVPIFKVMLELGPETLWISPRPAYDLVRSKKFQVCKDLVKVFPQHYQIITGFSEDKMIECKLPAQVGGHHPPDRAGWEI